MKNFFRNIHLYLSLAAGIVIMIACFTGAVLVFEDELQEAFHKERYFSEPLKERLSLEQLVRQVKNEVPSAEIGGVKVYSDPTRNVEIGYTIKSSAEAGKGKESRGGRKTAFVNPYTGQVMDLYSYRETFFYQMFALHRWLLGDNDGIGKYVVGVCTFSFLFILITGIILWWPKTRNILVQRLKVKWDGSWKRLNHDFHQVLGFYTAIFLFIFAFTGLAWSFQWFNKGIYTVTRSEMKPVVEPPSSVYLPNKPSITLDAAYTNVQQLVGDAVYYTITAPKDSAGVYAVQLLPVSKKEMASDTYYVDQYSGKSAGSLKFSDKNLGQRVRASFKPVHTGSIFGIPSKIIAFIACICGVTFPITGVIIWINRLNKKSGKKKKKASLVTV